jgi:hypothetical protein
VGGWPTDSARFLLIHSNSRKTTSSIPSRNSSYEGARPFRFWKGSAFFSFFSLTRFSPEQKSPPFLGRKDGAPSFQYVSNTSIIGFYLSRERCQAHHPRSRVGHPPSPVTGRAAYHYFTCPIARYSGAESQRSLLARLVIQFHGAIPRAPARGQRFQYLSILGRSRIGINYRQKVARLTLGVPTPGEQVRMLLGSGGAQSTGQQNCSKQECAAHGCPFQPHMCPGRWTGKLRKTTFRDLTRKKLKIIVFGGI